MTTTPSHCHLTIESTQGQQELDVRCGLGLQAVALKHKTALEFDCRAADCGICLVEVLAGAEHLNPPQKREQDYLQAMRADSHERLACQCRVLGDVRLRVPDP